MRQHIVCDPSKCTGCEICEQACSAIKEKSFNPLFSRMRAVNLKLITEPINSISMACFLCEDAACVTACPENALEQSEDTGLIQVDTFKCVARQGCGWCIQACEFGAVALDPDHKWVIICDRCPDDRVDDDPPCVKFCPKDALSLATIEEVIQKSESEASIKILQEFSSSREDSKTHFERVGSNPIRPQWERRWNLQLKKAHGTSKTPHKNAE